MHNLAVAFTFLLAACGQSETESENVTNPAGFNARKAPLEHLIRSSSGFAAAAADESRAAEIGRDVLSGGGNATDAAVAMYFAMAVTLPSAAGLGATGACISQDSNTKVAEAFVFPPIAAPGPVGGVSFAVPMGVRAITLMHIRHGSARWEALIAPAERFARSGVPVSRALSRDLQVGASSLGADPEARRVFGRGTSTAITEGDTWAPVDLAATLGVLRQRGGADMFTGGLARLVSDQVRQMGGSLPLESLRGALPFSGAPMSESYGGFRVYTAPAPMAGANALAGWDGKASGGGSVANTSNGISGFAAVDAKGGAAACALSMGQLFGTRKMVPGTGMLLAAISSDSTSVSPLIIGNPGNGEFRFAGAGGGSPEAAAAVGAVARATIDKGQALTAVLNARNGQGGYVNALVCPEGVKGGAYKCQTAIDPAGAGLSLIAPPK